MKKGFVFFAAFLLVIACSPSQKTFFPHSIAASKSSTLTPNTSARGALSPAAPLNLTYQVENFVEGQPQRINIAIATHLSSGTLLVEVAKQEGAEIIGDAARRIDLATAAHPIALQLQAIQLQSSEHYLVLLLSVETPMGPMSRSFRIDLSPSSSASTL